MKHTNPVHALYAPHRQLWKEALAIGKDILLMLLRGRVTSFNFFFFWNNGLFPIAALAFVHSTLAPHDWLGSDVILDAGCQKKTVSGDRVIVRSQQNADWFWLLFSCVCVGGGMTVFGFDLLHISDS